MDVILIPVINILIMLINLYLNVIFVAVIVSWLISFGIINISNRFVFMVVNFLKNITDPLFRRIDKYIPTVGGISFSPIVLIFACIFIRDILVRLAMKF